MTAGPSPDVFLSLDDATPPPATEESQEYRSRLDTLVEAPDLDLPETVTSILKVGTEWLDVENGHLTDIDPATGTHTVVETSSAHPAVDCGATTSLSDTYCRYTIARDSALAVTNAPEQGFENDPAYDENGFATYVGAKVVVDGELHGTVCFVGQEPRREAFEKADAVALSHLVESMEEALEQMEQDHFGALRRSQRRFEALLDDPHILAGILAPDGTLVDSNETAMAYIDADREDVLGVPFWETPWWTDELRPVIREKVQKAAEGEYIEYEADLAKPDGEPYSVSGVIRPVRDRTGEVTSLVVSARDVTESKNQKKELRRRKALLEQTQKLAGAWEVDPQTGDVAWTDEVYRIHELDPGTELSLDEGIEFYAPEARRKARSIFRRCVEDGEAFDVELPIITADGNRRYVRTVGAPSEGEVIKVAGAFQDITERKEAERKLRESRERLKMAVEGGNIGTWDWDLETGEVLFNRQWAEMLGYSRDELDFHFSTWEDLVHPIDLERALDVLDRYIAGEVDAYDQEIRMRTKSGEWKWVRTIGKVIDRDETGEVTRAAGIHLDIDERKRAEEILGAKEEQILGRTYNDPAWNLAGPEGGPIPDEELPFAQVQSAGEPVHDMEISIEGEGGDRKYLSVSGAPLEGEASDGGADGDVEEGGMVFYISDITEQKRRKQQLERQNDLFRRAQEIANVGAWEHEVPSGKNRWTDQVYRIYGYEREMDSPPPVEDGIAAFHPDDQPVIREAFTKSVEEGVPFDLELRLRARDEEQKWVRVRGEPQRGEEGDVIRVRGTIRDITEQKRRERTLQEVKSRYQTLVENFPEGGVFLFDENLTYQLAGGQGLAEVGLSVEEVLGQTTRDLFPDEIADQQVRYFEQALDGKSHTFEQMYQGRRYRIQAVPVRGEEGEIIAGMAVSQNITEQWRQRKELENRKAKIRALYETVDRLIRASGPDEVGAALVEVTREALGYEGVSVRFVRDGKLVPTNVAESTFEFMPAGRPALSIDGESAVAEIYQSGETVMIDDITASDFEPSHDYGELRSVVVAPMGTYGLFAVGSPEPDAIGEFDAHLIEVLARYAALVLGRLEREKRLLAAKEEAEAASQAKSAFLANMSHEIRTPLTSIIGFAEAIGDEIEDENDTAAHFAHLIEQGGHRLMETLTGILNLSKLQAGKMGLSSEVVDLASEATEIVEQFRLRAEEAGIILQVEDGDAPIPAGASREGVRIALRNLVSNAIKYTEEGGQVWVRAYQMEEAAILEVEDTGIGMSTEMIEEAFEPFQQASEGMRREYEGTGLGLAVTRRVVEQMGGAITVDTEEGEGTCFTLELSPAQETTENPVSE